MRKDVGDVNILVNNAGIMITKQFLQQSDAEIQSTVDVSICSQHYSILYFIIIDFLQSQDRQKVNIKNTLYHVITSPRALQINARLVSFTSLKPCNLVMNRIIRTA